MVHIKPNIIIAVHITLACARKAKDGDTVITWGHTFMSHLEARIINMNIEMSHFAPKSCNVFALITALMGHDDSERISSV